MSPAARHAQAVDCARRVKLMAFDVDGVLTDGSLIYSDEGIELKAFNTLDGLGLKLLQQAGVSVAIITGRRAPCVELRAQDLAIPYLFQGVHDKLEVMRTLLDEVGLGLSEAGYMGDDLVDLPVMTACAFSATPSDGQAIVRQHARLTTTRGGGRGAVREACDFILAAQDKLAAAWAPFLPKDRQ